MTDPTQRSDLVQQSFVAGGVVRRLGGEFRQRQETEAVESKQTLSHPDLLPARSNAT